MAQPTAIDPVQRPAPTRANSARGKQNANFALALDEMRDPSKNKIERPSNKERTSTAQNREPVKDWYEMTAPRKTGHGRHRASETKHNTSQPNETPKPEDQAPPSPQEVQTEDVTQSENQAVTDATTSTSEDQAADHESDQTAEAPAEIPLPQQMLTPNTPEKTQPPAQPAPELQYQHKDGDDVKTETEAVGAPSAKQAVSVHQAEGQKPVESGDAAAPDEKPAIDEKHHLANKNSETDESTAQKPEAEQQKSDPSEKSISKAETHGARGNPEPGSHTPATSGQHNPVQHHLGPDAASTPLPSPHAPSDVTKPNPVPYHALPIEIGLRALDGAKEITLDLTPKELGQLNIRILIDDQSAIQVSIVTDKPQTLALLQHDASHIRHALEQAGYSTQDSSLQFSLQNNLSSNSNSSRDDQRKQTSHHTSNSDLDNTEIETTAPIRQRVYLNQLDLSV